MRWTNLTGMQWRTTSLTFCLEPSQMTASSRDKAPGTYSKGGVYSTFSTIWLTSGLLMVLPCGVSVWLTIALGAPHWLLFPLWPDCGLLSVQLSSVAWLCPTLCNPMDCSTPGFPVQHQLPKLAQTNVHPQSSPSPPAFSLPQHQGPFYPDQHQVDFVPPNNSLAKWWPQTATRVI